MQDASGEAKTAKTDTLRHRRETALPSPAEKTLYPHPLRLIPLPPCDTMAVI